MSAGTTPEPALYERFTVSYPSGTVIESYYPGGATLVEVEVTHPMAVVEVVEKAGDGLSNVASPPLSPGRQASRQQKQNPRR